MTVRCDVFTNRHRLQSNHRFVCRRCLLSARYFFQTKLVAARNKWTRYSRMAAYIHRIFKQANAATVCTCHTIRWQWQQPTVNSCNCKQMRYSLLVRQLMNDLLNCQRTITDADSGLMVHAQHNLLQGIRLRCQQQRHRPRHANKHIYGRWPTIISRFGNQAISLRYTCEYWFIARMCCTEWEARLT